jgi:hypothetical protein
MYHLSVLVVRFAANAARVPLVMIMSTGSKTIITVVSALGVSIFDDQVFAFEIAQLSQLPTQTFDRL